MRFPLRAVAFALAALLGCSCRPFRDVPYSTVVEARGGELLGARTASDGQWRFSPCDTVPERFAAALVNFEDKRFYYHPGVDPLAVARALRDNLSSGGVRSGGSTITMQLARLSRGGERTLSNKVAEALLAVGFELRYSKEEILALYASHAPFGGNVVGLEAASWRYFGRPPEELSWAESAMLAVLPNAPGAIHPGKNRDALRAKRDGLLRTLCRRGVISARTLELSLEEPLPEAPLPLPSLASHYVERQPHGVRTVTSVDLPLQRLVEGAVSGMSDRLAGEGIADMAAIVLDNRSGEVLCYVGNASSYRARHGRDVDIAASPRSTGSILKPFLYEAALESGIILPGSLLPDVPVNLGGFSPQNFDRQFYGAVPASEALSRSLNVPMVFLLRDYGVEPFYQRLVSQGITTLTREPSHYGLSLILGGGECSLEEIAGAYRALAARSSQLPAWYTLEAMKGVVRPDGLDLVGSARKAAWKTGTSYGFRDAWAVGVTVQYTIGVWVGNADGTGAPGLIGTRCAGPVLYEILNLLPYSGDWFREPSEGGIMVDVCADSGFAAGPSCPETVPMMAPAAAVDAPSCPYHAGGEFRLPPVMEWYYRQHHPQYMPSERSSGKVIDFIYPSYGAVVRLPKQMDGSAQPLIARVAHSSASTQLWWHMDGSYLGKTTFSHTMSLNPSPGLHRLTAVDSDGNSASVVFSVE